MWYVFHRRESMCLLGEELHKLINLNGHVSTHWEAKSLGLPSCNGAAAVVAYLQSLP